MTSTRALAVCGIDVGSTNTKVVLVDRDGRVVAVRRSPTPRDPTTLQVSPHALVATVERLILDAAGTTWLVAALAAAGVGEDGLLIGRDGVALTPAAAWFDPRRDELVVRGGLPDVSRRAAGIGLDAARTAVGWSLARTTWPEAFGAAAHWVALTDLLGATWSSTPFMSDSLAARTAAWDPWEAEWLDDVVSASLRRPELLPPVLPCGSIVGPLSGAGPAIAEVVSAHAQVVVGGHDHPVGGWAATQAYGPSILDSMGTAEVVVAQVGPQRRAVADTVDVAPGILQPGLTVSAVEDLSGNLRRALEQQPELKTLVAALISGESVAAEPSALRAAEQILHDQAERGARALARVAAVAGDDREVLAAGGWSRSLGWMAVKASVNPEPPTLIAAAEVTAIGAALLAAQAIGWTVDPRLALS